MFKSISLHMLFHEKPRQAVQTKSQNQLIEQCLIGHCIAYLSFILLLLRCSVTECFDRMALALSLPLASVFQYSKTTIKERKLTKKSKPTKLHIRCSYVSQKRFKITLSITQEKSCYLQETAQRIQLIEF